MNRERRKALAEMSRKLVDIKGDLEGVLSEEEEALDAMPDGLRNSDKGQEVEEIVEKLKEAQDNLETSIGCIDEISEV